MSKLKIQKRETRGRKPAVKTAVTAAFDPTSINKLFLFNFFK